MFELLKSKEVEIAEQFSKVDYSIASVLDSWYNDTHSIGERYV